MATADQYIGRREQIGLGIESAAGTAVTPQCWMKWLDHSIQNKASIVEDESAIGVVDRVSDSAIVAKWSEGKLGGKVTSEGIGFLLYGLFGTVTTGTAVGGIYPHTFSVNQSSIPKTLTIGRSNPLAPQSHTYGVVDSVEITAEAGKYVQVSSAIKARVGETSSLTPAYTSTEKEFTSANITAKLAANVAGLGAASVIKSQKLTIAMERPSEAFNPLGTSDDPEFDRGVFEAKGELVLRYDDDQYDTAYLANTAKALLITLTNGTTTLSFTGGQVRFRELERSTDKDNVVTQTLSFYCEYSPTEGEAILPVLNNTRATYAAA